MLTIQHYLAEASCSFADNTVVNNNIIASNIALTHGGGVKIYFTLSNITNNSFIGNIGQDNGGAIHCISMEGDIINNEIIGNATEFNGGGLYLQNGHYTIYKNIITNNYAGNNGGGLYGTIGTGEFSNNIVAYNTAGNEGGGLHTFLGANPAYNNLIYKNSAEISGGGIYISNGQNTMINNTIVGNSANSKGGGIYITGWINTFRNNLFWDNKQSNLTNISGADLYSIDSSNIYHNNLLQIDSSLYTFPNYYLGANAQGNLFAQNPIFFNISNLEGEDLFYLTQDDGLRLTFGSPALNAGTDINTPATDILGVTRDLYPDIGAYENGVFVGIQPNTNSQPTATLNAYPNPATDAITFTFTTPTTDNSTLLLYAIDGQNITTLYKGTTQAGQTNTLTIDTKAFTPGTYCAVLRCGTGLAQHRTIIIK